VLKLVEFYALNAEAFACNNRLFFYAENPKKSIKKTKKIAHISMNIIASIRNNPSAMNTTL